MAEENKYIQSINEIDIYDEDSVHYYDETAYLYGITNFRNEIWLGDYKKDHPAIYFDNESKRVVFGMRKGDPEWLKQQNQ